MNIKELVSDYKISIEWEKLFLEATYTLLTGGMSRMSVYKIVEICSSVLKKLHSIEINSKELNQHDVQLLEIESNVNAGIVDADDFEDEYQGYTAKGLFEQFNNINCNLDLLTFTQWL